MSYDPHWHSADAAGRVTGGESRIRLADAVELIDAVNRRRRLVYRDAQDFSAALAEPAWVRAGLIRTAGAPPYDSLRSTLDGAIIAPNPGGLGGVPASPEQMQWLWPVDDGRLGDAIVPGASGGAGEVALHGELNGTATWANPHLGAATHHARAAHVNELRQAVQWLRRGRWRVPVYWAAGLFSGSPDTPWGGGDVANNGAYELRCVGRVRLRTGEQPPRGVTNATVLSAGLEVTASEACELECWHTDRAIDFDADRPTWNHYDPSASAAWTSPGGDGTVLGTLSCPAGAATTLTGPALLAAVQQMVDGAEQNFLVRRTDAGPEAIGVTGRLTVTFELNTPPN